MQRRLPAVVPVVILSSSLLAAESTMARTVHVNCVDGIPNPLVQAYQDASYCDADRSCNGVCTFAFCNLIESLCSVHPTCAGPDRGVCAPGEDAADTIVVPARQRKVLFPSTVHSLGVRVVLRCRPSPRTLPCP